MKKWVEVDRNALRDNLRFLKRRLGEDGQIMAVLKANAYGFGLVEVARVLVQQGLDWMAVISVEEAVKLREAGIRTPILVLGYIEEEETGLVTRYGITPTVYDRNSMAILARAAQRYGQEINVHIKIDTGMHRFGFLPEESLEALGEMENLPGIKMEALYSHFADVRDREFTEYQYKMMADILFKLQGQRRSIPMVHMANSQATVEFSKARFDMVRPGRLFYGSLPYSDDFKTVMAFKTRVASVKKVSKGETIGYGRTYKAENEMTIVVLPIGYWDGFGRNLSNKGKVLIRGKKCPVVGRVCMNLTMVDVSELGEVKPGDEVVIIGEQGEEKITVEEVAAEMGTNAYEVMARIPEHVERIYLN